jgi:3-oxoacyl-[acyl-carrier protein] reductase
MNLDLYQKTALVCGSTAGIGNAIAHELAQLGARVVLIARNEEKLEKAKADLPTPKNQTHSYLIADITHVEEVEKEVQAFVKSNPIHILINNTGGPPGGPIIAA